jgi:hypothetical protein
VVTHGDALGAVIEQVFPLPAFMHTCMHACMHACISPVGDSPVGESTG